MCFDVEIQMFFNHYTANPFWLYQTDGVIIKQIAGLMWLTPEDLICRPSTVRRYTRLTPTQEKKGNGLSFQNEAFFNPNRFQKDSVFF